MTVFRLSLRTWLLALSLLTTLPVLVLSLSVLWDYKTYQQEVLLERLERRTTDLSAAVAERIKTAIGVLDSLAASEAALELDVGDLYDHARRIVARNHDYRAISLAGGDGELIFLTAAPLGKVPFKTNAPDLVLEALRTQSPNVSGPFPSPVSPIQVVAVTVPVVRDGQAAHALRLILSTDLINQMIAPELLPKDWVVGIADRNGILVARSHGADRFVGKSASNSFIEAIRSGQRQVFPGTTLDGVKTINLVLPVFGADWYMGIGVPVEVFNAPVNDMVLRAGLLTALWLAVSMATAVVLAAYLARQMTLVVSALEQGETTLSPGRQIRVQELWRILQRFWVAKRGETSARSDLHTVAMQRDEVQDLYDRAPCGFHSLDQEGRIVQMNQTELAWLGLTREQAIGRHYTVFLTEASQAIFQERFPQFVRDGTIKDLEMELIRGTGTPMPILVSATAVTDEHGRLVRTRTTVFDNTDQKMMEAQLDRLARTDVLTALSNRRDFYDHAQREMARSERYGKPLSLLLMDIDHFKKINDSFGHAGGDQVLRRLSRCLGDVLREIDIPARMGGEEFAVLMPETSLEQAAIVAERLRVRVEQLVVELDDGRQVRFTVSMGLATCGPQDADIDATLARADEHLYRAKHQGRNQVCA